MNGEIAPKLHAPLFHVPRIVVGATGACVLTLVIGVIAAVMVSHQPTAAFAPGGPQATVATYLRLIQSGDLDRAYDMTQLDSYITRAQFHMQFANRSSQAFRATLLATRISGVNASVDVEVASNDGSPFDGSSSGNKQTFTLQRDGKHWLITGPPYISY